MWMSSPAKQEKPTATASIKLQVEAKAKELIENVLKPIHIKQSPEDQRYNYIIDIGAKWHRNYFYFFSSYACPGPNAIAPTFESNFARMEYRGFDKCALSYMRHNGKWVELFTGLSVDDCINAIQDDPWFQP
jgi:hypothetical protein